GFGSRTVLDLQHIGRARPRDHHRSHITPRIGMDGSTKNHRGKRGSEAVGGSLLSRTFFPARTPRGDPTAKSGLIHPRQHGPWRRVSASLLRVAPGSGGKRSPPSALNDAPSRA